MTEWSYVAVDTQLGYALADLPLVDVKIALTINGAGTMTATLPLDSSADPSTLRAATTPFRTTIYALADGNPIYGGIVGPRELSLGANAVKIQTVENWAWFGRWRFPADGVDYSGDLRWGLAALLLPDSMSVTSDPDLWVTSAPLTVAGGLMRWLPRPGYPTPTLVLPAADRATKSGAELFASLSQEAHPNGFDFGMVHTLGPDLTQTAPNGNRFLQPYISTATVWYPWRGNDTHRVFEWPGDAVDGSWLDDASNVAAKVVVEGAGLGKQSTITATAYNADLVTSGGWPWAETHVRHGQATRSLAPIADACAAAAREPNAWPKLTVRTDEPNAIGSYGIGDQVRVRITHDWFGPGPAPGVDEAWRVMSMTITPEGTSGEQVELTLMPTWSAT